LGQTSEQQYVLGKRAADLNLLLSLDAPLETAASLCLKVVLMWTRVCNWVSFLKAYPFLTPILEINFRTAYINFAGGLSMLDVNVLEHRKKIILHFWSLGQSSPCGNVR